MTNWNDYRNPGHLDPFNTEAFNRGYRNQYGKGNQATAQSPSSSRAESQAASPELDVLKEKPSGRKSAARAGRPPRAPSLLQKLRKLSICSSSHAQVDTQCIREKKPSHRNAPSSSPDNQYASNPYWNTTQDQDDVAGDSNSQPMGQHPPEIYSESYREYEKSVAWEPPSATYGQGIDDMASRLGAALFGSHMQLPVMQTSATHNTSHGGNWGGDFFPGAYQFDRFDQVDNTPGLSLASYSYRAETPAYQVEHRFETPNGSESAFSGSSDNYQTALNNSQTHDARNTYDAYNTVHEAGMSSDDEVQSPYVPLMPDPGNFNDRRWPALEGFLAGAAVARFSQHVNNEVLGLGRREICVGLSLSWLRNYQPGESNPTERMRALASHDGMVDARSFHNFYHTEQAFLLGQPGSSSHDPMFAGTNSMIAAAGEFGMVLRPMLTDSTGEVKAIVPVIKLFRGQQVFDEAEIGKIGGLMREAGRGILTIYGTTRAHAMAFATNGGSKILLFDPNLGEFRFKSDKLLDVFRSIDLSVDIGIIGVQLLRQN